jgi:hypothetical protein
MLGTLNHLAPAVVDWMPIHMLDFIDKSLNSRRLTQCYWRVYTCMPTMTKQVLPMSNNRALKHGIEDAELLD